MKVPIEKPLTAEELVHYGVKGMRWGYRKREETVPRRERRAIKRDVQVDIAQKKIDEIRAKPAQNWYTRRVQNQKISDLEKVRDQNIKDAKDIREGHLTDHQKKVLIGVGATAAVLAAYGTYRLANTGEGRELIARGKEFVGLNAGWKRNSDLSGKMSSEEIMKKVVPAINPNYGAIGTKVNCRRCTIAYELRRRGLDVAATHTVSGAGQSDLGLVSATHPGISPLKLLRAQYMEEYHQIQTNDKILPTPVQDMLNRAIKTPGLNGKDFNLLNPVEKSAKIFSLLERNPEGARGELSMSWLGGGGHSMAWEIINGKAHIFDAQSGEEFPSLHRFGVGVAQLIKEASITRLDNVNLNEDWVRRWARNVK